MAKYFVILYILLDLIINLDSCDDIMVQPASLVDQNVDFQTE